MCFQTTKGTRLRIAKEDIIVYKKGKRLGKGTRFGAVCRHGFFYEKGVLQPKVKLVKKNPGAPYDRDRDIFEGYHSFIECPKWPGKGRVLGMFIIPKGTGYYQNEKERVAETTIWVDFLKVIR